MRVDVDFIGSQWGVGVFIGPQPVLRIVILCVLISVYFGEVGDGQ